VVREWWNDAGWGVVDSPATPGGCWVHFSVIRVSGYRALQPGQEVLLEWEAARQDGYDHRAVGVWPVGSDPVDPSVDAPGAADASRLEFHQPRDSG
jgi:CspA family cold shock protein